MLNLEVSKSQSPSVDAQGEIGPSPCPICYILSPLSGNVAVGAYAMFPLFSWLCFWSEKKWWR